MITREPVLKFIKKLKAPFFTTQDISRLSGKSASTVVQALNHLAKHGVLQKIARGVWAENSAEPLNPLLLIPHILSGQRAYLSFISALHLYGIISQIPQEITLASTLHTKKIRTFLGAFAVHRISPDFFFGFDWHKSGGFLVASPEKALLDCLYIAARKNRQFAYFPELTFPASFKFAEARRLARQIKDARLRTAVSKRLEKLALVSQQ